LFSGEVYLEGCKQPVGQKQIEGISNRRVGGLSIVLFDLVGRLGQFLCSSTRPAVLLLLL
tara:strand:- start:264 stop:443 length:180 start_codon:yes stop_codon:yes gene_type:complete